MIRVQVKTFVPPEDTIWVLLDPGGLVLATADGDHRGEDGRLLGTDTAMTVLWEARFPEGHSVRKARRLGFTAERVHRNDADRYFGLRDAPSLTGEDSSDASA